MVSGKFLSYCYIINDTSQITSLCIDFDLNLFQLRFIQRRPLHDRRRHGPGEDYTSVRHSVLLPDELASLNRSSFVGQVNLSHKTNNRDERLSRDSYL